MEIEHLYYLDMEALAADRAQNIEESKRDPFIQGFIEGASAQRANMWIPQDTGCCPLDFSNICDEYVILKLNDETITEAKEEVYTNEYGELSTKFMTRDGKDIMKDDVYAWMPTTLTH